MTKYAENTTVSPEKSLMEIRGLLKRYSATDFAMLENEQRMGIAFAIQDRKVRFFLPMPKREDCKKAPRKYTTPVFNQAVYDQAIRQRWRALLLVIKAKLESVESGIETFDEAFASQLVLANGQTLGEYVLPLVAKSYAEGQMPQFPLLGSGV